MKKALTILLVLSLILCSSLALAETPQDDKSFAITLTDNPTTGYTWSFVADEEIVSVEQEFLSNADIDKLAGIEPTEESAAGEGGLSIFTVKGVKPGETLLALEYSRSGEENSSEAGLIFSLVVNDDLSVVCVATMLGI